MADGWIGYKMRAKCMNNRYLSLYLSLGLCLAILLSGCSGKKTSYPAELKKEKQMEEIQAFLTEHQAGMEEIVDVMMKQCDRENGCQYIVSKRTLELYDRGAYKVFTDHPIITKASILEEELFSMVYVDTCHRIVSNNICCFTRFVDDDKGLPYCEIVLLYCEEEPVEHAFFELSPVIPHWYFYIEYLE